MQTIVLGVLGSVSLGIASFASPLATTDVHRFEADLRGSNVAPDPVSTDARGRVQALLKGNTLTVVGSFSSLSSELRDLDETPENPGIHIHPGAAGETNSYLFGLAADLNPGRRSGVFYGTFDLNDEQRGRLLRGEIYVDIHTKQFRPGEVRDQLKLTTAKAGTTAGVASNGGVGIVPASGTVMAARFLLAERGLIDTLRQVIATASFNVGTASPFAEMVHCRGGQSA